MPINASTSGYPEVAPGRQLRTRPIDVHKKLHIVRSVNDLTKIAEEEYGFRVDPAALSFRPDASFIIEEKEAAMQKRKSIAVPNVEHRDLNITSLSKFELPDHYLRYEARRDSVTGIYLDDGSIIHFDLLQEDELFLQNLQKKTGTLLKKPILSEMNFSRLVDRFEKASGKRTDGEGEISFDEALKIKKDLRIDIPSYIIKEVHNYWKRRCHALGRPLLRMFWPQTSPHDTSPFAVFRPRTKDKMILRKPKRNQAEIVHKLERLLDDFKKVEKIFKKMKQRDEKKLLLLEINELLFDQIRHEIVDPNYKLPHWDYLKESKFDKTAKKIKKEKERIFMETLQKMGVSYPSPLPEKKLNRHLRRLPASPQRPLAEQEGVSPIAPPSALTPIKRPISSISDKAEEVGSPVAFDEPNFQLQIIRRRGRGGRIWLDRKHVVAPHGSMAARSLKTYTLDQKSVKHEQEDDAYTRVTEATDKKEVESVLQPCPPIGSNLDSFDILEMTNYFSHQRSQVAIVDTLLSEEDTYASKRRTGSTSSLPDYISNKNSREGMEFRQSFRAWIKYSLPLPPLYHESKVPNGLSQGGGGIKDLNTPHLVSSHGTARGDCASSSSATTPYNTPQPTYMATSL